MAGRWGSRAQWLCPLWSGLREDTKPRGPGAPGLWPPEGCAVAAAASPLSFSYCSQMLSKEVDACVTDLLRELVRFQDRMYQKDPVKAKTKRRLVLGLREVLKHLKLRKLKCIIISPNCEKIQSKGNELGRVVPARPQPGRLLPACDRGPFPGGHLPTRGPALCSRRGCGLFALRPKELTTSRQCVRGKGSRRLAVVLQGRLGKAAWDCASAASARGAFRLPILNLSFKWQLSERSVRLGCLV